MGSWLPRCLHAWPGACRAPPDPMPLQLAGLALYAETIWVTADQYKVYPILGVSGKDDVYAGAWIAIFCGFAFFCLGVLGIIALARGSRPLLMVVGAGEAGVGDSLGGWEVSPHSLPTTPRPPQLVGDWGAHTPGSQTGGVRGSLGPGAPNVGEVAG